MTAESWLERSEDELIELAGKGVGEPGPRVQAQAEMSRRLLVTMRALRDEIATSSERMVQLTWALVVMTAVLVVVGIGTVWAAIEAANG
jgi:cytochrome c-type biogenesis protein CcmH/NrfG